MAVSLGWIPFYPDRILYTVLQFLASCGIPFSINNLDAADTTFSRCTLLGSFFLRPMYSSSQYLDLRSDLEIIPAIFNFWGMLSGIIQLAANKEEYIKKSMGLSKIVAAIPLSINKVDAADTMFSLCTLLGSFFLRPMCSSLQ